VLILKHIVCLGLMLVVLVSCVYAADYVPPSMSGIVSGTNLNSPGLPAGTPVSGVEAGNRFLAAEVSRQMMLSKDDILKNLKEYQDENYRILDGRLIEAISDMKMKMTLGVVGAILFVNAFVVWILARKMRNYSFEKYQEDLIGKQQQQIDEMSHYQQQYGGVSQMQQPTWAPQQSPQTFGMAVGQAKASEMTQMNAWQAQPAYDGAWKSPIVAQPNYSYNQEYAGQESVPEQQTQPWQQWQQE